MYKHLLIIRKEYKRLIQEVKSLSAMSNGLAMELLRQSLGSSSGHVGSSGYGMGGCCGSALLGGAARREKPLKPMPIYPPNASPQTQANLERARQGLPIGNMRAQQYLKLHSPEAKLKAKQTRVATSNQAKKAYNDRINSGNPMSRLEYCMTKCKISNDNRKIKAQESNLRRLGRVPRLGPAFNRTFAGLNDEQLAALMQQAEGKVPG